MNPEEHFIEVTSEWVEGMRRKVNRDWAFVIKDEMSKVRVGWKCEVCGWKYWVRLVGDGG